MKAMPFHLGHKYLIDTALKYSERVTVLVGTLPTEPIPGELRFNWVKNTYISNPGIAVLCNDPSPQLRFWLETLPQIKIVIYDNDKAGEKLIKLGDYAFSVEEGKDLNDLSPEDAKKFLDDIITKVI